MMALSLLPGCRGGNVPHSGDTGQNMMRHARNITMTEEGDSMTFVTLRNPWDTTRTMARYALVPRGYRSAAQFPAGIVTLEVPLERSIVYSGVHVSLIDEFGAMDAVSGICDAEYVSDMRVRQAVSDGKITDCGNNSMPVMERIISLRPQAVLLSPYEKSDGSSLFTNTGIDVVETADYMELTPLGRAEWMRFYGRLYGKGPEADSIFNSVEKNYLAMKQKAASSVNRPSVLFDRIYSGIWDVPTSRSVTGHLIEDAGGTNPFADRNDGGSAHLTPEEVLYTAQNADIWLIRHFEANGLSLDQLGKDNPIYGKFKAFRNGNVFSANTLECPLFEDGAFHPDRTLREMIRLIHPEKDSSPLQYYTKTN